MFINLVERMEPDDIFKLCQPLVHNKVVLTDLEQIKINIYAKSFFYR